MPATCGLGILLGMGVTSGCLTPEQRAPAASAELAKGEMQCDVHRITGTLVATRVCTLKSQREAIQQGTRDARDFLDRQVIAACPGGPGCNN
jgi:hypothetical protein